jgi:hypothetical protein
MLDITFYSNYLDNTLQMSQQRKILNNLIETIYPYYPNITKSYLTAEQDSVEMHI